MLAVTEPVKSTHRVEIVPVVMEKHPNADSLSIVKVFGGYDCVVKTADWQGIELAAYIPPDSTVDVRRPEFSFLAEQAKADCRVRIKAKKLRGVVSFGLLIPAPEGVMIGEDIAERLGVEHYEPPQAHEKRGGFIMGGEVAKAPDLFSVKYDVDAFRRHHGLFVPGEPVLITEKLDGSSARYVYLDGQFHCGSRNEWKKEFPTYDHVTVPFLVSQGMDEDRAKDTVERLHAKPKQRNLWWEILHATPKLKAFLVANPGVIVHGEVFGLTNLIRYGLPEGNRFAAFDLMRDGHWVDADEFLAWCDQYDLPRVPLMADPGIGYSFDLVCQLAEGNTLIPDSKPGTMREGVVIRPMRERRDPHAGRINFKCVSGAYLEKFR